MLNRSSLFVHIQKVGGGTITAAMRETARTQKLRYELTGSHRTLGEFEDEAKKLGVNVSNLTVFTLVRNPWDRMVSMYIFFGVEHPKEEYDVGNRTFDEWIHHIYSPAWPAKRRVSHVNMLHYCFGNQLDWLDRPAIRVRVLRYERYDDEVLPFLRNEIGVEVRNTETRVHSSRHAHFCTYYSSETQALVAAAYQRDIAELHYSFQAACKPNGSGYTPW